MKNSLNVQEIIVAECHGPDVMNEEDDQRIETDKDVEDGDDEEEGYNGSDWEMEFQDDKNLQKNKKIDIMCSELASAIDRAKLSDRKKMYISAAIFTALGLDASKYNI